MDAAGDRVDLSEGLSRLLRRASEEIAAGHNVTMLRSDEVLTPKQTLPSSAHRRLLFADVLAFQTERDRRRAGVEAFRRAVEDADLADA